MYWAWKSVRLVPELAIVLAIAVSASSHAAHAAGPDLDGDGIPDGSDNCPAVSNNDQSDADQDDVGDVCDVCMLVPDPRQDVRVRLNAPLVLGGSVAEFVLSPDGTRVFYVADQDTDEMDELYSTPLVGGPIARLNGPLTSGGNVRGGPRVSPDGSTVVYRADQGTGSVPEAYSVAATGGTPIRLNASGQSVFQPSISPDGTTVAYRETNGSFELYSVPIGGGSPVKLNASLPAGGIVHPGDAFSPDSSRVVYAAEQDTDDVVELYSVPAAGGESVKLNEPLHSGHDVLSHRITPDGAFVVYGAATNESAPGNIYRVPLAGGATLRLNGLATRPDDFRISSDGGTVVYLSAAVPPRLFAVPIEGGLPVELSIPATASGNITSDFELTPDGSRAIALFDWVSGWPVELYSSPTDGSPGVRLSLDLTGFEHVTSFETSPDGGTVVYRTAFDGRLYSVPVAGGASSLLVAPPFRIQKYTIGSDNTTVLFANGFPFWERQLYTVPISGGPPTKVSGDPDSLAAIPSFALGSDEAVAFLADVEMPFVRDLYSFKQQVQPDNDNDGHGDACDNCGLFNPSQDDADIDGTGDECDCAPLDNQSWSAPGEVLQVDFIDNQTLQWDPPKVTGAIAPGYDTLRGTDASSLSSALCVESGDASDRTAQDEAVPALGAVFFYVVRAVTPCGTGLPGTDTDSNVRDVPDCP